MTDYEFVGGTIPSDLPAENSSPPPEAAASGTGLANLWELFGNQREIVTGILMSIAKPEHHLSILGCGNCLDIDLQQLSKAFAKVSLFDLIDASQGVKFQNVASDAIEILSEVDVSGVDSMMDQYARHPSRRLLDEIIMTVEDFYPPQLEVCDVVASTCLLSQLVNKAVECVGVEDHRFVELIKKIRFRHIQIMLKALKPGGAGFLVTDFVSSETLPELKTIDLEGLRPLVQKALAEQNYFHGMNPSNMRTVFEEPSIADEIASLKVSSPWRWVAGDDRVYACYSLIFTKRSHA